MAQTFSFYKEKDPNAILDYTLDWTAWLDAGDTITACTVSGPAGITVSPPTVASPKVTARVSGGTDGTDYDLVWHVTVSDGQQDERTLRISVNNR